MILERKGVLNMLYFIVGQEDFKENEARQAGDSVYTEVVYTEGTLLLFVFCQRERERAIMYVCMYVV